MYSTLYLESRVEVESFLLETLALISMLPLNSPRFTPALAFSEAPTSRDFFTVVDAEDDAEMEALKEMSMSLMAR